MAEPESAARLPRTRGHCWLEKVAAVIEAFYPGQEAGSSIAALLFGDVNPSGKLAITFPANEQQVPGAFLPRLSRRWKARLCDQAPEVANSSWLPPDDGDVYFGVRSLLENKVLYIIK